MKMPVSAMFASEMGIRNFQASCWSWSSRKRGSVKRTQNTTPTSSTALVATMSGPTTFMTLSLRPQLAGRAQPPRNSVEATAANATAVANSAMK